MNREEMIEALVSQHAEDLANWTSTEFTLTPLCALKSYLKMCDDGEVVEMYEEWKDL